MLEFFDLDLLQSFKIACISAVGKLSFSNSKEYITHCPECNTKLVRKEGEAQHYCLNDKSCPPQIKAKIEHFISRKAMNIDNLGSETIDQFFKELNELEEKGINTKGMVFIAKNTHIITKEHLEEDGKDTKIGTTKRGNGPAYRDKYARDGFLAQDIPELEPYLIDLVDWLIA